MYRIILPIQALRGLISLWIVLGGGTGDMQVCGKKLGRRGDSPASTQRYACGVQEVEPPKYKEKIQASIYPFSFSVGEQG